MPRTTLLKLAALFGGVALGLVAAEGVVRGLGLGPVLVVAEGRYRLSSNPRIAYEPPLFQVGVPFSRRSNSSSLMVASTYVACCSIWTRG